MFIVLGYAMSIVSGKTDWEASLDQLYNENRKMNVGKVGSGFLYVSPSLDINRALLFFIYVFWLGFCCLCYFFRQLQSHCLAGTWTTNDTARFDGLFLHMHLILDVQSNTTRRGPISVDDQWLIVLFSWQLTSKASKVTNATVTNRICTWPWKAWRASRSHWFMLTVACDTTSITKANNIWGVLMLVCNSEASRMFQYSTWSNSNETEW